MTFFGLSLRRILTSVLVLGSMVDLIAFRCNPERGSGLVWAFNQVQNISHRVADAICDNPEDCRHVTDQFFACVSSIPQDVLAEIAECLRNAQLHQLRGPKVGLLLRVEEHRTRHQNGMSKRETLSLIYDKYMQPGSCNRDKLMH